MIRKFFAALILCTVAFALPAESMAKKSEAQIQAELDKFVFAYVDKVNKRMTINRKKPQVVHENGRYVARFTEIDRQTVQAEVRQSRSKHFQYVARLRYHELTFECEGKTRKEALKGPFRVVRERRLTEMPRYVKGKWEN
jgi:hypothetical protein